MPSVAETIESAREALVNALADDAVNPKPDYSIDGQTVSRVAWRKSLTDTIEGLGKAAQAIEPFELRGFAL